MTTTPPERRDTGRFHRILWWSLAAACALVLATAGLLEPDARGFGTHVQLGLPPCGFLALTGAPCPGCGLTTAFAHAVRGDLALAASANPFGLLLFALVCVMVPFAFVAGVRRWSIDRVFSRAVVGRGGLVVAACGVVVWVVRVVEAL